MLKKTAGFVVLAILAGAASPTLAQDKFDCSSIPGAALVHQLLVALEAAGGGDDGTQALYTLYEKLGNS